MERVVFEDLTLRQFLRLPEAKPALESIDGRVIQKAFPNTSHSSIQSRLGYRIFEHSRPNQLGLPYPELQCTFGGRSLVPDLALIARGRIPRDSQGKLDDRIFLAPDLIVEILSPGQTVKTLVARLRWCVANGVRLGWLIQPRKGRVYVVKTGHAVTILEQATGSTLDGEDVLPGFALPLAELFAWLVEE